MSETKEEKPKEEVEKKGTLQLKRYNYPQEDGKNPIVVLAKDRKEADNKLKEELKKESKDQEDKE